MLTTKRITLIINHNFFVCLIEIWQLGYSISASLSWVFAQVRLCLYCSVNNLYACENLHLNVSIKCLTQISMSFTRKVNSLNHY